MENIRGLRRQAKQDKQKKTYPPARALPIRDRFDRRVEERRIAKIVKRARG